MLRLTFHLKNLPHRFSREKRVAGDKWYYGFIANHPAIPLRQPEANSVARARGFCKENVTDKIVNENNLDVGRIFNMHKTALSTVQKPQKVLARKGKHQVGAVTSVERGTNPRCMCCMSAAGMFVRPLLKFKKLRFKFELSTGASPGTQFACTENGWITSDVFIKWLKHFIQTTQPSKETKVLLLLDGHTTHTKKPSSYEFGKKEWSDTVVPPSTHCTSLTTIGCALS
jgi:hypothetical protein